MREPSVDTGAIPGHGFGYTVSLELDRDSGETHIVVTDCGSSCVLIFPVPAEKAGEAFSHPHRYAP